MDSDKIRPEHPSRRAFVYVRQSSLGQVRQHRESSQRQYDLEQHARALGWADVVVVDDDQGKSGATAAGRPGFQRLVAEVSLGRVGAVFGLEVSRLARNNRDWYQLLDLCGLMNTLIVDAEGIYDPRLLNDRLLLGLKGTMSEAELGWIRQRAWEGALHKARRGELVTALPAGYVRTEEGRIEKHPDQRVRHAISLVFAKFAELGSAHQSVRWFRQQEISLPAHDHDPARGHRVRWRFPRFNAVVRMLRNPFYAGAYAFGRTMKRTTVVEGVPRSGRAPRPSRDEWLTLIHDHHEAYIPWDVYERNQYLIDHNATSKGARVRGAVRGGPSLLPGLLRCGHCGRKLHVRYTGTISEYMSRVPVVDHVRDGIDLVVAHLRKARQRQYLSAQTLGHGQAHALETSPEHRLVVVWCRVVDVVRHTVLAQVFCQRRSIRGTDDKEVGDVIGPRDRRQDDLRMFDPLDGPCRHQGPPRVPVVEIGELRPQYRRLHFVEAAVARRSQRLTVLALPAVLSHARHPGREVGIVGQDSATVTDPTKVLGGIETERSGVAP
jgi:DNA invertase Pin-like site-specific DNA recombinase